MTYARDGLLHVVTYVSCDKGEMETFPPKCDLVQFSYKLADIIQ
ncbi:hypothetical protein AGMMS49992_10570 [Clostridia bacterium]|nr:hypothetical protein AGMMS49992_10570 [Clostridia bacterium]